jgi:hypothetical protein
MATSLTRPNTPMPTSGAVRRPPPGPYVAPGPTSTGPSLDAIAQSHGYPDFAAWKDAEPELAQQAYNNQPSGDPSQATTQKPGPRGFKTIPWKGILMDFGTVIGLAYLDGLGGLLIPAADGTATSIPAGEFALAGNTATVGSQVFTLGDTAALIPGGAAAAGLGAGGGLALSQLSRSGQPPPLRNSPQDQALRQQPEQEIDPKTGQPIYRAGVNQPLTPPGSFGGAPPPPSLTRPGTPMPQPPSQTYIDPSQQQRQDQQYAPGSLDQPPPAPPKPGSSLLGKILPLLGLPLDYLATRQSQNATNTATQQLVQAGQQAKADLAKVYGGVTPVLSQVVQRQQANLAPYTSLGSGAASLLGYGLGIPGVQAAPSGVYAPPIDPFSTYPQIGTATTTAPPGSSLAATFQPGVTSPYVPPGPGQTPSVPFPSATSAPAPPQPASSLSPQTQTQSSYVTMRAPNGEVDRVPREQQQWFESKGAVAV